jgi:nucleoside-diphosphate-sugar epimerase
MNFTIFGGCGYVGNELIKQLLTENHNVICVDNFYKGHADNLFNLIHPNLRVVEGDIRNGELVKKYTDGADVVINLAAIVGVPACSKDPYNVYAVNAEGPRTIVENLDHTNTRQVFIQASTDSVFGAVDVFCDETTTPNPQSTYGKSKLLAEQYIQTCGSNFHNKIIIRFSTGKGVSGVMRVNLLVNDLVFSAIENRVLTIFEGDALRTFINVKDMSRSLIHMSKLGYMQQNKYNLYCVGDNALNYTKRELALKIQQKVPCELFFVEGKDPDKRNYKVDHTRLDETGFKCQYSMDDTIDELIKVHNLMKYQKKYQ